MNMFLRVWKIGTFCLLADSSRSFKELIAAFFKLVIIICFSLMKLLTNSEILTVLNFLKIPFSMISPCSPVSIYHLMQWKCVKMYQSQEAFCVIFQDQKIFFSTDHHLPSMTNKLLGMNIDIYLVVRAVSVSCWRARSSLVSCAWRSLLSPRSLSSCSRCASATAAQKAQLQWRWVQIRKWFQLMLMRPLKICQG